MFVALVVLGLIAAYIDWQTRTIPNWLSMAVAALGIMLQLVRLSRYFTPVFYNALGILPLTSCIADNLPTAKASLFLAVVVLVCGICLETLWRQRRGKAGMGFGDIKYIAAWTCTLSFLVLIGIMLACLMALIYSFASKQRTFAFAPWLSLGFIAMLFLALFVPSAQLLVA